LDHIVKCAQILAGYQLAIEFRNKSWFDAKHQEDVLAFERDYQLAHVVVDGPQGFASSIPSIWEATCSEVAVVRLHGRNRETWDQKDLASSAERFNYLYTDVELHEMVGPISSLSERTGRVHVFFNNNFSNYAQLNAAELSRLLA
jgi:uncharacterized protein YecE (DUF72 family)